MQATALSPLKSPLLSQAQGIRHGFFDRTGGVSKGQYATLNCGPGSGDDAQYIGENRARVAAWFDIEASHLISLYQIHSAQVVVVDQPWTSAIPQADAMVTKAPGLALSTLTADCGPLLLCDAEAGVIGAAHAGWQGALKGVVKATLATMEAQGARRSEIRATLGPTISQSSYQVGPEFKQRFLACDEDFERFFTPSDQPGHHQFDLPGFILHQLEAEGIDQASHLDQCTYRNETLFSYRRATHQGQTDYGRNLSAIMIEA